MSYTARQLALSYPEQTKAALAEMILVNNVLNLTSFRQIIFNPQLTLDKKKGIITQIFAQNFSQNLTNFILFLSEENSLREFDKILSEFKKILKNDHIALSGTVTSSKPISPEEKKNLEDNLGKKIGLPVVLEIVIKPALLGGVILNVDGLTYDNSYRYKLSKLR